MLIWAEGFDHYGTTPNGGRNAMLSGAWAAFSAGNGNLPAIVNTQVRSGTHALQINYNSLATDSVRARRVLGSTQIGVGVALGVYFNSLPEANGGHGFEFRNNLNQCIAYISVQSDGALGLYTGAARTLIASSDPIISASSWQHIEARMLVDNLVGEFEVRVNGQTVLNLTDINLGVLGATQISFGMPAGKVGGNLIWFIDDIVPWNDTGDHNNDFIGPCRVEMIMAEADTAQADWTPVGDTDGFDCIDNIPPDGDTTFLYSEDVGDISEFELQDTPIETANIRGVYIPTMGKLIAAGTGNVQTSMVSGADVSLGPDQTFTTSYSYWGGVHEVDPATDLPWTKAGLDTALLRIEKTV